MLQIIKNHCITQPQIDIHRIQRNKMKTNFCKLCGLLKPICKSHAIPNSIFKSLFRENSGKGITLSDIKDQSIEYSSDSLADDLLCSDCESQLNRNFDAYGLDLFRGHHKDVKIIKLDDVVVFRGFIPDKINGFLLSILWRAAISNHPVYSKIKTILSLDDIHILHDLSRSINTNKLKKFSIRIKRLNDKTGGFTESSFRGLIVPPFIRHKEAGISICFSFLGYLFEIFVKIHNKSIKKSLGTLSNSTNITIPKIEISEIPEIFQLFVQNYGKYHNGLSNIK